MRFEISRCVRRLHPRSGASALIAAAFALGLAGGVALSPGRAPSRPGVVDPLVLVAQQRAAGAQTAPVATAATGAGDPSGSGTADTRSAAGKAGGASDAGSSSAGTPSGSADPISSGSGSLSLGGSSGAGSTPGSAGGSGSAPSPSSGSTTPDPTGAGDGSSDITGSLGGAGNRVPALDHVWFVAVRGSGDGGPFAAPGPYLRQLRTQGTLLEGYAPLPDGPLANGIALLSGQAPNAATRAGCPTYVDVAPATLIGSRKLATGTGCVYPATAPTLASELTDALRTWRAFAEGQGAPCRRPAAGAADPAQVPGPDGYVSTANPFTAFHGVVDNAAACAARVADLAAFGADLAAADGPPAFTWIAPSAFHDGSDTPTPEGAPGGTAGLDGFLQLVIPPILASKAYRDGGLIAIIPTAPASARGALLLSPKAKRGHTVTTPGDPYALLRLIADALRVDPPGRAAGSAAGGLEADTLTATAAAAGG